jgi:tetratricopeptide (TPR) repeat protein
LVALGKQDEALPMLKHAVDMDRATLPPRDPRLADALSALAAAYVDSEHYADAKVLLDEAIAILERRSGFDPDAKLAIAYTNRAECTTQMKVCERSFADLDRALAIYQHLKMGEVYDVLNARGDCELDTDQWSQADATSQRVLAAKDATPEQHVLASFVHGRAAWNLGHKPEGIAEVRAARAAMKKDETNLNGADFATRWLAAHGG